MARGIRVWGKTHKYCNNDCMINLLKAFIYPYSIYCNHIYRSTYKTDLSELKVLQNKVVRIVTWSPPRSKCENMYRCSEIMNLNYINAYLVRKCIYKIYHKSMPSIFSDFFRYTRTRPAHPHSVLICLPSHSYPRTLHPGSLHLPSPSVLTQTSLAPLSS